MMSTALDDIVDLIDDAARAIIIFDVKEITDYARDFADVIERMLKFVVRTTSTFSSTSGASMELSLTDEESPVAKYCTTATSFSWDLADQT